MARHALWNGILVLRVTLRDIEPPVWRRVRVPAAYTLAGLHHVVQLSFGWTDLHLHAFEVGDVRFGTVDVDDDTLVVDERCAPLGAVVVEGTSMVYRYDFGDDWEHEVLVEQVLDGGQTQEVAASCLEGGRACPPEDCGGAPGYARVVEILADRTHEEHRAVRAWVGKKYDPEAFDIAAVNRKLSALSKRVGRERKAWQAAQRGR